MTTATRNSNTRVVLWSMTLANAMILVDQTAVPLALPNIMRDFGVGSQQVQWVLNASLPPLAGLLVLGGRLGDMFGRRRIFIIGAAVFTGASAIGALAPVFPVLLACRMLQGSGEALILPNTVAIVAAAFPDEERGRALGLMGGVSAVAGALGPTVGGALAAAWSWRAIPVVDCLLAVVTITGTLRAVPPDSADDRRFGIDLAGTILLTVSLISLVFGLSQSQVWGWAYPGVYLPLIIGVCTGAVFLRVERAAASPLMNLSLLWRHSNYLGGTASQFIVGMVGMGLALLFPLLLILNLQMSPALAGLALIPTTLPFVFVPPLAGRWYDRVGGRMPLITGFATLLVSTVLLAWGVHSNAYPPVFPGLLLYGIGLALILTVNDPVSLDMVPASDHGQVSGVSTTAEHFGGAIGIAVLYLVFHATYVHRLHSDVSSSALADMTRQQSEQFKNAVTAAVGSGLQPNSFDSSLTPYLLPARAASEDGYSAAFIAVSVLCLMALVLIIRLVHKPPGAPEKAEVTPAESRAGAAHDASPGTHNGNQETIANPQQSPAAEPRTLMPLSQADETQGPPLRLQQESAATAPPQERPPSNHIDQTDRPDRRRPPCE
jgi:EmrB/QacA subfamily drug resistance transporter